MKRCLHDEQVKCSIPLVHSPLCLYLCEPTPDGGLGRGLHRERAAGLDFDDVLQNPDPVLQDIGRVGGQVEGLLLSNQLLEGKKIWEKW